MIGAQTPSSTRVLAVTVGKGGTGKSTIARVLLHRAQAAGRKLTAFDADVTNGTLTRFYRDAVIRYDGLDQPEAIEAWFEQSVWPAAETGSALLDCGAGIERVFGAWAELLGGVADAKDVTVLTVFDRSKDGLATLEAITRDLPMAHHVIVLNEGRLSASQTFGEIRDHRIYRQAIATGAKTVLLPRFERDDVLDNLNVSFADAVAGASQNGAAQLGPFDRQRLIRWLRDADTALEPVEAWLP